MLSPSTTRKSNSLLHNHKQTPNNKKAMEDVWKDINLASLTNHTHHLPIATTSNNMRDVSFQHFLAPPLNFITTTPTPTPTFSSSKSKTSPSLHSPVVTALNLNSLPEFHFDDTASKMFMESDGSPGDRRYKRMMKNRESAERSRARKQAYIFELKKKVKSLEEENARLRRQQQQQQQQMCDTAANQQQKKGNLYRTSTAPF